ncbi:MAG: hypothetical protein OEW78_00450 [Nitrosopumilus sp.]|uniref:hypothetical protein n=1 Tax=Nitrosopumilus sp. TaxID=2024843 RepID=UPI0024716A8C|nr:hypothetical protein [Nitrosopumilus sp.]MDH5430340.1 hypothetical protein [Nitrosopumilus sp.]
MKMSIVIAITGILMFASGLVMFYLIELGQTDPLLRFIKNTGTFVGISGMGVFLAGVLLHLINKSELSLKEHSDV